jgi:hypothetical protein
MKSCVNQSCQAKNQVKHELLNPKQQYSKMGFGPVAPLFCGPFQLPVSIARLAVAGLLLGTSYMA